MTVASSRWTTSTRGCVHHPKPRRRAPHPNPPVPSSRPSDPSVRARLTPHARPRPAKEPTYDRDGREERRANLGNRDASLAPRRLVVEVLAARDLEAADFGGTSDPYVLLELDGETRKTEVIPRSLRPVWGARFELVAAKALADSALTLSVFDHDAFGSHDFLGGVRIPIRSVEEGEANVRAHWVRLRAKPPPPPKDRGTLRIGCYMDADVPGRLRVHVVGARGIEAAGAGGASDPYVRVSLLRLGEGQVPKADDARRTKTVYKTLEPVWDEHFVYEHVDRKSDSTLLLELFYQEYVSADRETAQIVLPVAALPRARPGDTRGEPVDRPWAEHTKNRDVSGALCLSPFFVDGEKTRLCVRVLRATDIKAADMGGTSDAYVKATLRGGVAGVDDQVFRTKVVHKTVAPVWRHDMFFRVRPSTGKEIRAAAGGARRGVLGAVLDGVGERAERAARAVGLGCARGDPGAGASAGTTSSSGRARTRFFRSSRATQFLGGGGDGFKTDVKARAAARERDVDRAMISSLGDSRGAASASAANARLNSKRESSSEAQNVAGQTLELDLYDHDEGVFDADDFLGRVSLPLEHVPTASEGGERRTVWMPLRRKKDAPVKGEALVRAYFPDPEPLPPVELPDALTERLRAESDANAKRKRERLHKETYGLHQELEAQLKMQLLMHSWPLELAQKYARAYARHGHESHLIPPPPEGCTVPASFAHMFETAERATALAERERAREKLTTASVAKLRLGGAGGLEVSKSTRALVDEARAVETRTKRFDAIRDAMRAADRAMETRRARDSEADEAEARENANAAAARESRAAAPDAAPDAVRDAATSRAPWCLAADDGPAGRYLSAVAASVSRSPLLARPIAADASSLPPSSTALAAKLEGSRFASFYAANERGLARGLAAPPRTCRGPPPPRTKEETRVRRGTAVDDEALSSSTLTDVDFRLAPGASSADAAVSNSSADERRVGSKPRATVSGRDRRARAGAPRRADTVRARSGFDSFGNLPVHLRATPESSGAGTSAREEENARGVAVDAP